VDNDLQTLIRILEEEKSNLLKLIDNSVKDQEYLFAHFHFEALRQVNSQLQTLKNLGDELYDEKNSKLETIEGLKKLLETEKSDRIKEYLNKQIGRYYEDLQRLNEITPAPKQESTQHILDNYFNLLFGKKIRLFRLVLNKGDNLALEIKRIKGTIRVTLSNVNRLIKEHILFDERIHKLMGLGFKLSDKRDKLVLTLTGDKNELKEKLRTILLIIVFEVFYYREFIGQTYIET
jgi:hypothetical protein